MPSQSQVWTPEVGYVPIYDAHRSIVPMKVTAAAQQAIFSLSGINYRPNTNSILIWVNGNFQVNGVDYHERDPRTIEFVNPLSAGAQVLFIVFTEVDLVYQMSYAEAQELLARSLIESKAYTDQKFDTLRLDQDSAVKGQAGEYLQRLPTASQRSGKLLSFNSLGQPIAIAAATDSSTELASRLADNEAETEGASLVGYEGGTVATALSSFVDAASHGFHPLNTGEANQLAIKKALEVANGRKVVVHSDVDFQVFQLSLNLLDLNYDVDLEFSGSGWVNKPSGGVLNATGGFIGVQTVSDIQVVTLPIGNVNERVTRVSVPNASEYAAGDIVRIVSDDIDPRARDKYTARRGEVSTAVAVDVSNGYIYLPIYLEEVGYMTTNIRILRYSHRKFKVQGLKVKSSQANESTLMSITGFHNAFVDLTVDKHGYQALVFRGMVDSTAKINVDAYSGKGEDGDDKILSYGFTDRCGMRNRLVNSYGRRLRHLITTLLPSIDAATDDLFSHGAPKYGKAIDCVAISSQNVPFDEHEGAVGYEFVRCYAGGGMKGTNDAVTAFQLRGDGTKLTDCSCDASYEYAIAHTQFGTTPKVVNGGFFRSTVLVKFADGKDHGDIILNNVHHKPVYHNTSGSISGGPNKGRIFLNNCLFELTGETNANPRGMNVRAGMECISNNTTFILGFGSSTSGTQLINIGDNAKLIGDFNIYNRSPTNVHNVIQFSAATPGNPFKCEVVINWMEGAYNSLLGSGYTAGSNISIQANNYTTNPKTVTNRNSGEVIKTANTGDQAPRTAGDIVIYRTSDNSKLILRYLSPVDGQVYYGNIPLSLTPP